MPLRCVPVFVLLCVLFAVSCSSTLTDSKTLQVNERNLNNSTNIVQLTTYALLSNVYTPLILHAAENHIKFEYDPQGLYENTSYGTFLIEYSKKLNARDDLVLVELIDKNELISKEDEERLKTIPKDVSFEIFKDEDREIAALLTKIFLNLDTDMQAISLAVHLRDRINIGLFTYAFNAAILDRPDFKEIRAPSVLQTMPMKFFDEFSYNALSQQVKIQIQAGANETIYFEIPEHFTATDLEFEQKLSYFREDIGLNMHHWHWHLINTLDGKRDRQGELFYYMHQQLLARYNFERFSNKMTRVKPINLLEPQPEGYFPKLFDGDTGSDISGRPAGTILKDKVNNINGETEVSILGLLQFADRILQGVDSSYLKTKDGKLVSLNNTEGINVLSNVVESNAMSINAPYYGSLHNTGHNLIGQSHDPQDKYKESPGVMAFLETATRDPIFYRWHNYVNYFFQRHKSTLQPYRDELKFHGIHLHSLSVKTIETQDVNKFHTFWEHPTINMNVQLSKGKNIDVFANITRLQNIPFSYNLQVYNNNSKPMKATVRIFLLPLSGDHGESYPLNEQRMVAIEMDRFNVELPGNQGKTIVQRSSASSVIQPDSYTSYAKKSGEGSCGCGWPQHLLVPKGNEAGLRGQLFAIITNTSTEEVQQDPTFDPPQNCHAYGYCGLYGQKYPTKLPMGFPFDRQFSKHKYLGDFVKKHHNCALQDVTIQFSSEKYKPQFRGSYGKCGEDADEQPFPDEDLIQKLAKQVVEQFMKESRMKKKNYLKIMQHACRYDSSAVVKALFDLNIMDNLQIQLQETCLHYAARYNHVNLAKLLLYRGSEIESRDTYWHTPLMDAVLKGNVKVAQVLIDFGANIDATDKNGLTVLKLAEQKHLQAAFTLLKSHNAHPM